MAFTRGVRRQIIQRDLVCQDQSGETHMGGLEAAHLDHDKGSPYYNSLETGLLLCVRHHLTQHLEATDNGLKEHQNNWAIKMLADKLGSFFLKHQDEP